jgi:tetratricopeptide (TPR) repeat protein
MLRSPILVLLLLFAIVSCKKETETTFVNVKNRETDKSVLAKKFSNLGDSYYIVKKFDSAYYYYNRSKEIFETEKDSTYSAYTLIQLARIQLTFGDYSNSEETLTEALPYVHDNLQYQVAANNLFGISAKELKNYDDAVFYYNKILETASDSLLRVTPLNNIANVYIEQKKYKDAIILLRPLLKSNLLDTLPYKKAIITDNLGFAYYKYGSIKKGEELMNQALAIRTSINDSYGSIASYLHLATCL